MNKQHFLGNSLLKGGLAVGQVSYANEFLNKLHLQDKQLAEQFRDSAALYLLGAESGQRGLIDLNGNYHVGYQPLILPPGNAGRSGRAVYYSGVAGAAHVAGGVSSASGATHEKIVFDVKPGLADPYESSVQVAYGGLNANCDSAIAGQLDRISKDYVSRL